MLTDKQLECIELLSQGTMTGKEIATVLEISERVIYKWKKNDEFKVEMDKRALEFQTALKNESKLRMTSKGQMAIDNIIAMANNSTSEKVKLDANIFIYEAIFGKPTTKTELTTENKEDKKVSWDDITLLAKEDKKEDETYLS